VLGNFLCIPIYLCCNALYNLFSLSFRGGNHEAISGSYLVDSLVKRYQGIANTFSH